MFISMLPLDADRMPMTEGLIEEMRVANGVDSGDVLSFPDVVFEDPYRRARYLEVRVQGLEIDGAGSTQSLAQSTFDDWKWSFRIEAADRRSYSNITGVRGGANHDLLFTDFFEVDLNDPSRRGYDPETAVGPDGALVNSQVFLESKGIYRNPMPNSVSVGYQETRQYLSTPESSDYWVTYKYQ